MALLLVVTGAAVARASEYSATVSVPDTIFAGSTTAEATISLTVTGGDGSEPISRDALPALPDGLAFASDGFSSDTCAPNAPLGLEGTCELTVTLSGTTIGTYDWSGSGDDGSNQVQLSTIGSIEVIGVPAQANALSGDGQYTQIGTEFSSPLTVEIRDADGNLLPAVDVVFTAPADGATATLSETNLTTDANGTATVTATASDTAGDYVVEVAVVGYPEVVFQFYLLNRPPPAKLDTTVSWPSSSLKIGSDFTVTLTLKNTSGRTIAQTLTTNGIPLVPGGLHLTGAIDWSGCDYMFLPLPNMATCRIYAPVRAGAGGTYHWTGAGTPGSNTNTYIQLADPAGLTVYSDATLVSSISGDDQSVTVGNAFEPLTVEVTDVDGIPVPGVQVTFTVSSSGASVTESTSVVATDSTGRASVTLTANQVAGDHEVTASASGIATPVVFSLTNLPGDPLPVPAITALSPSNGPEAGGTSVTITGSEFAGATSVTFGGVEADFELVDDTIVAISPAGSGTVDVLVTTPAGTSSAIDVSRFSYDTAVDPPDPSAESAELDAVQDTFTPVVAAQSSRSIVGSMTNAIRLGMSGGQQTSFSPSEMFLAYGPTPAEPTTPFDEILVDDSQPLADNVSIWLDTTGQGILPLSTTPERGWQVNITGGFGVRVTPDLLIGALAGHERFSYRSEDTGATLSGSGTSLGAYAGWDVGGRLLVSLGVVNTALDYRTSSGAASGTFQASRWLVTGDFSGEYMLGDFTVQPSATLLGIWESQDAYVDTLSGVHDERQFGSASASAGLRISHALPISEDWELAPYVGAYFDGAADATIGEGDATYGVSGRLTAGVALTSADGLHIGLDGELSGLGTDTVTLSARGNLRSSF